MRRSKVAKGQRVPPARGVLTRSAARAQLLAKRRASDADVREEPREKIREIRDEIRPPTDAASVAAARGGADERQVQVAPQPRPMLAQRPPAAVGYDSDVDSGVECDEPTPPPNPGRYRVLDPGRVMRVQRREKEAKVVMRYIGILSGKRVWEARMYDGAIPPEMDPSRPGVRVL